MSKGFSRELYSADSFDVDAVNDALESKSYTDDWYVF